MRIHCLTWLSALAVACALAGSSSEVRADAVTFSYDFTGNGTSLNPGPFSPSTPGLTSPTISASSYVPSGTSAVMQSNLGLGVASDPPGGGFFNLNSEFWDSDGQLRVDGVGTSSNGDSEVLQLTFNSTDPGLTNTVVKSIELSGFSNSGSSADFQLYRDAQLIGSFDFPSGGILNLNLSILSGQVLSFLALEPIGSNENQFAVAGLVISGETVGDAAVPEPASLAVWGFSLAAFGAYVRRRRVKAA